MITSSPTISQPPSPNTTFHTPAHRPYQHASRRTSISSTTHSSRLALTNPAQRRFDAPQTPKPTCCQPSPVPAFAPSPQSRKRSYADHGTQYTPPGFPPTYRPPPTIDTHAQTLTEPATSTAITTIASTEDHHTITNATAPATDSQSAPAIPPTQRGTAPAAPAVTEPPEPQLRESPQSAAPARNALVSARPASRDGMPPAVEPGSIAPDASTVLRVPESPAKRARPEEPNLKVMPLQYETCDVKDLGMLISDMLMELVRLNDGYPLRDGTLTRFHSRAPPGISVRDYLSRLIVHATLSPPILLSMVFYVDKLCAMYPAFTISSLTVHRFLITAATVAAKGLSDSFWTNSLYARVGGVSVRELALLELEFLRKLDWRIVPKPEVLVDYYKGLVDRGTGYIMEKQPESASTPSSTQVPPPNGSSATGIHTNESGV
ncbi:hypothetical protein COCCADRAFT_783 [Bipolaris zeicola 26-R-13]|uniref:Cyclin-domain-containing protein n=1 Tax=Cochliobolus carbonum (strain 26-R-13) TaxID=930089 RepID=W6YLU4_COCC2|nr:uncharacterized protein COCCADRAFT_783 [Bipolaris zeicola 26-R-13]EUC38503.1 hypothetical protein COCCADRAFT_783 [Bipolaris zeicola 26-R-13]